ncbi:polysaccharide biosynthesis/export family protein [Thalassobacter stenotrophicus]|uniref:polysaccharide biosynthesis/export family protein n=1 Tax=Thalassobacter stenotrophicus TaxID=266809 RepID=UPI0022A8E2C5|nr:polysaccharide biosynthesis/export family protein [Thalassobacter stenotrophicus]UYP68513.1 polysaccharide biosynthesis/export family protein [Thalassobacter stenotrophicus]
MPDISKKSMFAKILLSAVGLSLLVACDALQDASFPVAKSDQEALSNDETEVVLLNPSNIGRFSNGGVHTKTTPPSAPQDLSYRVGSGDVLRVIVWDHPELTSPGATRESNGYLGLTVRSDGSIFFPYAGTLKAEGRTTVEIAKELTAKLSSVISDPQVEVLVAEFNSQKSLVSGEIEEPGPVFLTDVPITLIEAISARGGATDEADLAFITLQRAGRLHTLDLVAFLDENDARQNPIIVKGDVIRVSKQASRKAYILGGVGKPRSIDLTKDRVNLTEAIAEAGGLRDRYSDARGVFVFREENEKTLVAQLDLTDATALLMGANFNLHAKDVVFVTRAPLAQWNEVISQILPSISGLNTVATATGLSND